MSSKPTTGATAQSLEILCGYVKGRDGPNLDSWTGCSRLHNGRQEEKRTLRAARELHDYFLFSWCVFGGGKHTPEEEKIEKHSGVSDRKENKQRREQNKKLTVCLLSFFPFFCFKSLGNDSEAKSEEERRAELGKGERRSKLQRCTAEYIVRNGEGKKRNCKMKKE